MVSMSKAKVEMKPLPKRFYKRAAFDSVQGGFVITLDGKNIRTPQQKLLHTKSEKLALAIAAEWDAQIEVIDTDAMPLTRLLNIALDRIALDREALLEELCGFAQTDLLCYRTPAKNAALPIANRDAELRALQLQHFDPILAWASAQHGLEFICTEGLMPVQQPATSLQKIAALFSAANDHELAALSLMVPILGSALLALAMWHGFISVDEALIAARLDEAVQQAQWGEAPEVAVKWAAKCRDVKAAAIFLAAHR
jgi:chaperone required for assembly of F1-ATPase